MEPDKWEYMFIKVYKGYITEVNFEKGTKAILEGIINKSDAYQALQQLGNDGWEAVGISPLDGGGPMGVDFPLGILFKRKKSMI